MNKLTLDDMAKAIQFALNQRYSVDDAECSVAARAILTTIKEAGFKIVPVECTSGMAGSGEWADNLTGDIREVWQAMIKASPQIEGE